MCFIFLPFDSRIAKSEFYEFCRTRFFIDFPPNLSIFLPNLCKYFINSMVISCSTCQKEEKECTFVYYVICAVLPRFQFCRNLCNFSANYKSQIFRIDKKMLIATLFDRCYMILPCYLHSIDIFCFIYRLWRWYFWSYLEFARSRIQIWQKILKIWQNIWQI